MSVSGLRLDLPVGPLKIDYGIPIQNGQQHQRRQNPIQRRLSILNERWDLQSNTIPLTSLTLHL